MRRYYSIYLFIICLIATSCDNTVLEEEISTTQVNTRNSTMAEQFALHNTSFINIKSLSNPWGKGLKEMSGEIVTYTSGVEYDFVLWYKARGDVKCYVMSLGGARISHNGRDNDELCGENGKYVTFTVKFSKASSQMKVFFETENNSALYKDASAKLLITGIRYQGEKMATGSIKGESHDLCIEAIYPDNPHISPGSTPYHWICSNCGFTNTINDSSCKACGK